MSSAGVITINPIRDESALLSPVHRHHSSESILVFVTTPDKIVPIRVLGSDSIESVKFKIQNCKGVVVKNQKLVSGGRELARSNSSVRDYGVGDGDVVHVCVRLSDLQHINVRTACGKEFNFNVERNRDVGYIKRQIGLIDIDEQEILCDGERVEDQRLINDLSKNNEDVVHLFVCKTAKIRGRPLNKNFELSVVASQLNDKRDFDVSREIDSVINAERNNHVVFGKHPFKEDVLLEPIIVNKKVKLPSVILDMIKSNYEGLVNGSVPLRSSEGTGGAYFMLDSAGSKYLSVFKPIDEEPMAANNPRGLPLSEDGEGLKKGTRVGQGALREVAAYVLDHPKVGHRSFSDEKGFAGVPPTIMAKCLHVGFHHPQGLAVKIGSLQMFMENSGSCEDMGPSTFPVEEVHKISVFDIRMANADRHAGNILVSKDENGKFMLIPIDHGYCLPESFEDCTFEWLYWPQARQPYCPDTVKYIMSLDAEEDIALLNFHGWDLPEACARILRISTMLLKKGVERGLTPFEIGKIMCRETLKKESVIEEIVQEAFDSVLAGTSEAAYLEAISQIMDVRLDEIAK